MLESLPGGSTLCAWYGGAPSFHDAEILDLYLSRRDVSRLRLHAFKMTDRVDAKGFYVLEKHMIVTFSLTGIRDLDLSGFNHQNVIFGLTVDQEHGAYKLTLEDCYGLSGFILASGIDITFEPSQPIE